MVIGVQRSGVNAATVIFSHVSKRRSSIGGKQHSATIGAAGAGVVLVVLVRAGEIDGVGIGARIGSVLRVRGRVHVIVIRTLRLAVGEAEGRKIEPIRLRGRSWGVADRIIAAQAGGIRSGAGVIAAA